MRELLGSVHTRPNPDTARVRFGIHGDKQRPSFAAREHVLRHERAHHPDRGSDIDTVNAGPSCRRIHRSHEWTHPIERCQQLSDADFIAWCKENFAANKYPRYVEFRDNLPIGNTGKISKLLLRKELETVE